MSEDKDALIYLADMRIDQLEAENAELRELCADMYKQCAESMGYEHPALQEFGIEV